MLKLLWRTLRLLFSIFLITLAHIFVINFFPFPFNHINITVSLLILFLTIFPDKKIIWLGLAVSYFSELFSSAPFGIGMAATTISLWLISWFQLNILTNRSKYMVFLSLLFGVALYRILFIMFLSINNYFSHREILPYKQIVADVGWEILLSSVIVFLLYLIVFKFLKHLNSSSMKGEIMYG